MDSSYDKVNARASLERLIGEGKDEADAQLHNLTRDPEWKDSIRIKRFANPETWRLVRADDDMKLTDEEMVFTVYGAIVKKDFPPLRGGGKASEEMRLKYMKQSVKLDRLGTPEFEAAIAAAGEVCRYFDREFPEGQLEQWSHQHEGHEIKVLDIANRMFTPMSETTTADEHIPFDKASDPRGISIDAVSRGFKRTEDNIVEYATARTTLEGKRV
ncbi:hypothetical protein DXG01_014409 [Tephrocybe rancida]|nr:hypothetical protein DXG01_014409 [Tephrocybe rancida]